MNRRAETCFELERGLNVTSQIVEAQIADRDSEVAAGHVFELMSFVEDHGRAIRQDAGVGRIVGHQLNRQVGEKQVMVHDDDVALHRPPVHLGNEAAFELLAARAGAGLGARIHLAPQRTALGKRVQFGAIA